MRAELKALLAGAAVLYLAGIWWGVPWLWAPDELGPGIIFDGIAARFAGGWFDKYPPVQYYLGAIAYLPFVAAGRLGLIQLTSYPVQVALVIVLRLLTVVMSVAAVAAIYLTASELYGRRGAVAAALLAGFTPVVVFYSKVGNVDMPSLCWFAWALRYYVVFVRSGERRALIWFALAGVTAIATKDQTAGFFVLPAGHVAWRAVRGGEARSLLVASGLAIVAFALEMNIPFNFYGFIDHVRMILGEASQPFRFAGSTWVRQTLVARLSVTELAWSMTWVGFIAGVIGVMVETWRRRFLWLLLPVVSYYLFFIVMAGYVYDRFLIGVAFVLAIFAGGWIDGFLRAGAPAGRWRMGGAVAAGAFIVWSGVSMDLMMFLDSRYDAARWMAGHRSGARVALVGFPPYLPYIRGAVRMTTGPADPELREAPRFVVINAEVMRRVALPPVEREWKRWLESDRSPYVVAARFKTLPAASLLSYTDVFRNGIEDFTTNLDKVGPEIVIYWRPGVLR